MAYTTLQLTQDEAVLTITANRPEVRNVQSRLKSDRTDSRGGETAVHGRSHGLLSTCERFLRGLLSLILSRNVFPELAIRPPR